VALVADYWALLLRSGNNIGCLLIYAGIAITTGYEEGFLMDDHIQQRISSVIDQYDLCEQGLSEWPPADSTDVY
jgi:hypothetical protein